MGLTHSDGARCTRHASVADTLQLTQPRRLVQQPFDQRPEVPAQQAPDAPQQQKHGGALQVAAAELTSTTEAPEW